MAPQTFREKTLASIAKARTVTAPENSVGQWVGYCLWHATQSILIEVLGEYLTARPLDVKLKPMPGDPQLRLPDSDGVLRQIDHAIFYKGQPLIIIESKWLKDQRHLNDKGSWLKLLKEVVKETSSVEQAILVLAGPWETYRDQMENRGFEVVITPVAEVYSALATHGVTITIDSTRQAYENPMDALTAILNAIETGFVTDPNPFATIGRSMIASQIPAIKATIISLLDDLIEDDPIEPE